MKRLRLSRIAAMALLCLTLSITYSYAEESGQCSPGKGAPGEGGFNRERPFQKVISQLGLTAEQEQLMQARQKERGSRMKELGEALRTKKMELMKAVEKPEANRKELDALVNELKTLMGNQLDLRVEGAFALKEILTPEQYQKFHELMKQGRKKGMRKGTRGGEF